MLISLIVGGYFIASPVANPLRGFTGLAPVFRTEPSACHHRRVTPSLHSLFSIRVFRPVVHAVPACLLATALSLHVETEENYRGANVVVLPLLVVVLANRSNHACLRVVRACCYSPAQSLVLVGFEWLVAPSPSEDTPPFATSHSAELDFPHLLSPLLPCRNRSDITRGRCP